LSGPKIFLPEAPEIDGKLYKVGEIINSQSDYAKISGPLKC